MAGLSTCATRIVGIIAAGALYLRLGLRERSQFSGLFLGGRVEGNGTTVHHRGGTNGRGEDDGGRRVPTIPELVGGTANYSCPESFVLVEDTIDPSFYEGSDSGGARKIPKVIHMTSKSRCMTEAFAANMDAWRLRGHSLFLHDDAAVDRLLWRRSWPEFPDLRDAMRCVHPGAGVADVWRYVMLYEYGGIYTDIDNAPGPLLGGAIENGTDALFEVEGERFPSQYFFAASPHHPLMKLAVNSAISRVMEVTSVKNQYVPFVTGPGATKSAMIRFMGNGYPKRGVYHGTNDPNRTVTIVGDPKAARQGHYVRRNTKNVNKKEGMGAMDMPHWSHKKNTQDLPDISCVALISRLGNATTAPTEYKGVREGGDHDD